MVAAPAWAHSVASRHRAQDRSARAQARQAGYSRIVIWSPGAWSWFADPRAVWITGRYDETFVGWIDWSGNVMVGAYDPRFGVVRARAIGRLFHDDHGSPALFAEPDKRLTVFWAAHNGSAMYYRSTLRPEDISAWGPIGRVPSRLAGSKGFTYPNPVLLPGEGNKLYLFWRGSDWSQDYATRTLDGHWSASQRLVAAPGQRPYVKVDSNRSGTIALAFTNGHPRETKTSIYYAAYRHGSLWTAGGRLITRLGNGSIAPSHADRVYDAGATGVSAWVWDVAVDSHQRPVIVYATFPSVQDHAYWYARWNGQRWVSHFMTFAGPTISPGTIEEQYSGGIALDHGNASVVYLSRKVRGWFEIERWTTPNGGYTWRRATVVRTVGSDNFRPVVPRGDAGGQMGLVWLHGHYGSYTTYRTSIALLSSAP